MPDFTPEQLKAILELYNLMNDFPKNHEFDLDTWIRKPDFMTHFTEQEALSCGTSCCAAGWATLMCPTWKKYIAFNIQGSLFLKSDGVADYGAIGITRMLAAFLGISSDDAEHLFLPTRYPMDSAMIKPHHVAERVKLILEARGYELYEMKETNNWA